MTITAGAPLPVILKALSRSAWSESLDHRAGAGLRATLHALGALLPKDAAQGTVTATQVADAAGMSERWARRCLRVLEDLGLITWRRGYLDAGRPRPGFVRVCKAALVELIAAARERRDERLTERRQRHADRVPTLPARVILRRGRQRPPLSIQPELSSGLPPYRGGTRRRSAPRKSMPNAQETLMEALNTPCLVCGRTGELCRQVNGKTPLSQRHTYTPAPLRVPTLIERPTPAAPPAKPAPSGWRAACRTQPAGEAQAVLL